MVRDVWELCVLLGEASSVLSERDFYMHMLRSHVLLGRT